MFSHILQWGALGAGTGRDSAWGHLDERMTDRRRGCRRRGGRPRGGVRVASARAHNSEIPSHVRAETESGTERSFDFRHCFRAFCVGCVGSGRRTHPPGKLELPPKCRFKLELGSGRVKLGAARVRTSATGMSPLLAQPCTFALSLGRAIPPGRVRRR